MKDNFLQWLRVVGFLIITFGAVLTITLSADKEPIGVIVILIGVLIKTIPYFIGKKVYVCPKCKVQFKIPKNEITLITSHRKGAAILTCPKCKKTNLCLMKLVLKTKNKID